MIRDIVFDLLAVSIIFFLGEDKGEDIGEDKGDGNGDDNGDDSDDEDVNLVIEFRNNL
jgi:hypothetical protein